MAQIQKKTHQYCIQNVGTLTDVNFYGEKNYGQTIHMGVNEFAKETNTVGKYLFRVCIHKQRNALLHIVRKGS